MKAMLQRLASSATLLSAVLLQAAQPVHGHYGFPVLIVNDKPSEWFEYIRPVTEWGPYYDYTGETQVCGTNGTQSGHQTKTAVVEAGSTISFRVTLGFKNPNVVQPFNPEDDKIYHPGPGQAYMSKAPGAIEDYIGDGNWFKIGSLASTNGADWDPTDKHTMNFTIPKTTPPGKYLVRVEQFNIISTYMQTQHYINCAQIEVAGPGGGTPGPFIKFPGGYDPKDKGIWIPRALDNPQKPTEILKKYTPPGPPVWTG